MAGWWMVCYVEGAGGRAAVAATVGPFRSLAQALAVRAAWLAVHASHRALPPWFVSDYLDGTGG